MEEDINPIVQNKALCRELAHKDNLGINTLPLSIEFIPFIIPLPTAFLSQSAHVALSTTTLHNFFSYNCTILLMVVSHEPYNIPSRVFFDSLLGNFN